MLIINHDHAAIINTPHESEIRPLIDRTTSSIERCSLAEEILPPGKAVFPHYHLETEEIYYILRGAGEMIIDDERRAVAAGDCIFIPRGAIHSLENSGTEAMTILLVCGPAYNRDDHYFIGEARA
jgi:mannose-6-phosphate isomerase-like protein (cupin superfamily)